MTTHHDPTGSHDTGGDLAARFARSVVAAAPPPPSVDRLARHRPRAARRRHAAFAASAGLVVAAIVLLVVVPGAGVDERSVGTVGGPAADVSPGSGAPAVTSACVDEPARPGCPVLPTRESIARFSVAVAFGYTTEELVTIRRAWNEIFVGCVAEAEPESVTRHGAEGPLVVAEPDWQYEADQLNFDNFELIEQTGYHWQFHRPPPGAVQRAEYSISPSNAVETRCKHAANDAFGGAPPGSADEPLRDADNAVRTAALDSSASLRQASARWTRCMETRGYPDREFTDRHRVLRFMEDPEPTAAEIAEALADAECRAASGYTAVRNDLIEAGVRQWQAGNAEVIDAVTTAIEREVSIAEQLLAGPGSTS